MRSYPGRQITASQIGELFSEAYGKAATVENACSGFRAAGAWPVDPDIIQEYEYASTSPSASNAESNNLSASFEDIVNVLRVTERRKTKRAEKSEIITSSPYKKKIKTNEVRSCSSSGPASTSSEILNTDI